MLQTRSTPTRPTWTPGSALLCLDDVWSRLGHLGCMYPDFGSWFWGNVPAGMDAGTRRVFTHRSHVGVDAVVIAKRTREERKLCTVWVADHARRRGLATDLIDEACGWLGTQLPLISVPEERMPELAPLLDRRGFVHSAALPSYYRQGRTEHVFNGGLAPKADC